jgi:hypothetical protein
MSEKLVYVPRNWKVSYVDEVGNEHENVALRANAEYRIVENGIPYNTTVAGIRTEEDKTYILAKVMMANGFMNVMERVEDRRFDVNDVTEITPIVTKYVKSVRSIRNKSSDDEIFTFAFDSDKYNSQYRISVYAGEFVALALKDPSDSNKKSRSIYGHIVSVDDVSGEIKFSRYVSNRGVRDVYPYTVSLDSLLGIYRYELEISDYVEPRTNEEDAPNVVETTAEESAE